MQHCVYYSPHGAAIFLKHVLVQSEFVPKTVVSIKCRMTFTLLCISGKLFESWDPVSVSGKILFIVTQVQTTPVSVEQRLPLSDPQFRPFIFKCFAPSMSLTGNNLISLWFLPICTSWKYCQVMYTFVAAALQTCKTAWATVEGCKGHNSIPLDLEFNWVIE